MNYDIDELHGILVSWSIWHSGWKERLSARQTAIVSHILATRKLAEAEKEKASAEAMLLQTKPDVIAIAPPTRVFPTVNEWAWARKWSVRTCNALINNFQSETIIDLACMSASELLRKPSFGKVSVREVGDALAERGLHFGMSKEAAEDNYCDPT